MRDISRETLLAELRALRGDLEQEGVTRMDLFGSRARRDNRADSDIDLVIEIDENRKFSVLNLIGVEHKIEDSIGVPANLFMRRSLDASFMTEVRRDEVSVF